MYIISLVIGDWSHDGHNQTDTIVYESSHPKDEVIEAYKKGVERYGVDITKLCADYEQSSITPAQVEKINHVLGMFGWELLQEDDAISDSEEFATVYAALVCAGNATISMKQQTSSEIKIGGYGLFYN